MSLLERAVARITHADRRPADDTRESGMALISALLFIILLGGLSVVLLSIVVGQIGPAYTAQKTTRTVYAAQAGLQAGLSILRSIPASPDSTGVVFGDRTKLPCALSARIDATDDEANYLVTLQYFEEDPTGQPETWQTANRIACSTTTGVAEQPKFALVISQGVAPAIPGKAPTVGNRTLSATYQFRVSNENVSGGRIYNGARTACFEATSATTGATVSRVSAATCNARDALQSWIYSTDYQIQLASTTVTGSTALCITSQPLVLGLAQRAVLKPCLANTDPGRWNQLWSWIGGAVWVGQKQTISEGPSSMCLNLGLVSLMVSNGCGESFAPEAAVGAGAAGYSTHQIVNYKEFGRCADVTFEDINYSFMISYPCKQDPTGTGNQLLWNHKWYYTEPPAGNAIAANQQVYVLYNNDPGRKYCMQAPAASGLDVVFRACTGGASQQWDRVNNTGEYGTSYLFIDYNGRCLAVDASRSFGGDVILNGVASKMTLKTCNGSDAQKWNAPPSAQDSTFGGFRELG